MDPPNGQQLIINEEAMSLTSSVSADGLLITALSLPLVPESPLIKAIVTAPKSPISSIMARLRTTEACDECITELETRKGNEMWRSRQGDV